MVIHMQITQAEDSTQTFLEFLQRSIGSDVPRVAAIHVAHMALHIWLTKNSQMVDSMWSTVRFIFERTLIMTEKIIDVTSRPLEIQHEAPILLIQ